MLLYNVNRDLRIMIKRTIDIFLSILGLVVLSPLFLVLCLLQKLRNPGRIFYSQERIGKDGKPFMILKYRTMIEGAEDDGIPLLAEEDDERLTPFGKWMRNRHLDELPQLWNVLRGDMSFVGYRPERLYFISLIMEKRPDYVELYKMRPGVTSIATIENGYTNTMEKMIRRLDLDLDYMRHQSTLLDINIMIRTFLSVFFGKHRGKS